MMFINMTALSTNMTALSRILVVRFVWDWVSIPFLRIPVRILFPPCSVTLANTPLKQT